MWFVRSAAHCPTNDNLAKRTPKRRVRPGPRFLVDASLGALLMVTIHLFVIQVSIVRGNSMEPALHDGDRLVVDRVTYNLASVGRGDVVVLRYPRNPNVDFVKRVVGVPGDRIAMRAGVLFINGKAADDYGCIPDHENLAELIVPPHEFFVLGDNRNRSFDSHYWGVLPTKNIMGTATLRYWPPNKFGPIVAAP